MTDKMWDSPTWEYWQFVLYSVCVAGLTLLLTNVLLMYTRRKRYERIVEKSEQLYSSRQQETQIQKNVYSGMQHTQNQIPVTIITGFLGAGKTTLLNYILGSKEHGKNIAVIENEFGAESIDHQLLENAKELEDGLFLMANGCMCCSGSGPGDELERILDRLLKLIDSQKRGIDQGRRKEIDYIIIETSGMADPAPIVQTFFRSKMEAAAVFLDAIVTVVDAKNIKYHIEHEGIFARTNEANKQIAYADVVLLNKIDLVSASSVDSIEASIHSINPTARILKCQINGGGNTTDKCKGAAEVPLKEILDIHAFDISELELNRDPLVLSRKADHTHSVSSMVIKVSKKKPLNLDLLNRTLSEILETHWNDVFRIKGMVWVITDSKSRTSSREPELLVIQGVNAELVGDIYPSERYDVSEESSLVVIGRNISELHLEERIKSCRTA